MARQSEFTQAVADLICERIADGLSLRSICAGEGMPATSTVFKWLNENKPFSDQYARAREAQADALFDEILDIADTPVEGTKTKAGPNGTETTTGDMIEHRRLQVEARKWMAGKLQPKKYSDKHQVELSGPNGGPMETVSSVMTPQQAAEAYASTINGNG